MFILGQPIPAGVTDHIEQLEKALVNEREIRVKLQHKHTVMQGQIDKIEHFIAENIVPHQFTKQMSDSLRKALKTEKKSIRNLSKSMQQNINRRLFNISESVSSSVEDMQKIQNSSLKLNMERTEQLKHDLSAIKSIVDSNTVAIFDVNETIMELRVDCAYKNTRLQRINESVEQVAGIQKFQNSTLKLNMERTEQLNYDLNAIKSIVDSNTVAIFDVNETIIELRNDGADRNTRLHRINKSVEQVEDIQKMQNSTLKLNMERTEQLNHVLNAIKSIVNSNTVAIFDVNETVMRLRVDGADRSTRLQRINESVEQVVGIQKIQNSTLKLNMERTEQLNHDLNAIKSIVESNTVAIVDVNETIMELRVDGANRNTRLQIITESVEQVEDIQKIQNSTLKLNMERTEQLNHDLNAIKSIVDSNTVAIFYVNETIMELRVDCADRNTRLHRINKSVEQVEDIQKIQNSTLKLNMERTEQLNHDLNAIKSIINSNAVAIVDVNETIMELRVDGANRNTRLQRINESVEQVEDIQKIQNSTLKLNMKRTEQLNHDLHAIKSIVDSNAVAIIYVNETIMELRVDGADRNTRLQRINKSVEQVEDIQKIQNSTLKLNKERTEQLNHDLNAIKSIVDSNTVAILYVNESIMELRVDGADRNTRLHRINKSVEQVEDIQKIQNSTLKLNMERTEQLNHDLNAIKSIVDSNTVAILYVNESIMELRVDGANRNTRLQRINESVEQVEDIQKIQNSTLKLNMKRTEQLNNDLHAIKSIVDSNAVAIIYVNETIMELRVDGADRNTRLQRINKSVEQVEDIQKIQNSTLKLNMERTEQLNHDLNAIKSIINSNAVAIVDVNETIMELRVDGANRNTRLQRINESVEQVEDIQKIQNSTLKLNMKRTEQLNHDLHAIKSIVDSNAVAIIYVNETIMELRVDGADRNTRLQRINKSVEQVEDIQKIQNSTLKLNKERTEQLNHDLNAIKSIVDSNTVAILYVNESIMELRVDGADRNTRLHRINKSVEQVEDIQKIQNSTLKLNMERTEQLNHDLNAIKSIVDSNTVAILYVNESIMELRVDGADRNTRLQRINESVEQVKDIQKIQNSTLKLNMKRTEQLNNDLHAIKSIVDSNAVAIIYVNETIMELRVDGADRNTRLQRINKSVEQVEDIQKIQNSTLKLNMERTEQLNHDLNAIKSIVDSNTVAILYVNESIMELRVDGADRNTRLQRINKSVEQVEDIQKIQNSTLKLNMKRTEQLNHDLHAIKSIVDSNAVAIFDVNETIMELTVDGADRNTRLQRINESVEQVKDIQKIQNSTLKLNMKRTEQLNHDLHAIKSIVDSNAVAIIYVNETIMELRVDGADRNTRLQRINKSVEQVEDIQKSQNSTLKLNIERTEQLNHDLNAIKSIVDSNTVAILYVNESIMELRVDGADRNTRLQRINESVEQVEDIQKIQNSTLKLNMKRTEQLNHDLNAIKSIVDSNTVAIVDVNETIMELRVDGANRNTSLQRINKSVEQVEDIQKIQNSTLKLNMKRTEQLNHDLNAIKSIVDSNTVAIVDVNETIMELRVDGANRNTRLQRITESVEQVEDIQKIQNSTLKLNMKRTEQLNHDLHAIKSIVDSNAVAIIYVNETIMELRVDGADRNTRLQRINKSVEQVEDIQKIQNSTLKLNMERTEQLNHDLNAIKSIVDSNAVAIIYVNESIMELRVDGADRNTRLQRINESVEQVEDIQKIQNSTLKLNMKRTEQLNHDLHAIKSISDSNAVAIIYVNETIMELRVDGADRNTRLQKINESVEQVEDIQKI